MGCAFSFLTSSVRSRTSELAPKVNALSNDENVDKQQNEGENCTRTQGSVCFSDSELNSADQNRKQVVKGKPTSESVNGATTYNIQVQFCDNVIVGDNNNIDVVISGNHMGSISEVDAPPMDMENRTTAPVDVQTQISPATSVTYNISVLANNAIVGESNEIKVSSSSVPVPNCDFRLGYSKFEGAMGSDETSAETSMDRQVYSTPCRLPSPGVEPQLTKVFEQMKQIVDELYPLRDRGKWKEFDQAWSLFKSEYEGQPVIKCFLALERSVRLTYQKRLQEGRKMAENTLRIVNNEVDGTSRDVLILLANIALASTFRRGGEEERNELGSAFDCLERAQQSGENLRGIDATIPKFALALLNYEQGRLWSEFAPMVYNPRSAKAEATKYYHLCMDRCRELSVENRIYIAKERFALIFLAHLSIPNPSASKKPSVKKTKRYLEEFDRTRVEDTPMGAKIKYFMTRSNLCFLEENYSIAEEHARQALNLAEQYRFDLEIKPAKDQIDRCHRSAFLVPQAKLHVKNISSRYACNSTTTTDSDQSASRSD